MQEHNLEHHPFLIAVVDNIVFKTIVKEKKLPLLPRTTAGVLLFVTFATTLALTMIVSLSQLGVPNT